VVRTVDPAAETEDIVIFLTDCHGVSGRRR
jgi:hypothetical protein